MTPVRIVVVDDHEVVRIGLANLLASRDGFVVTGQAGTAEAAIEAVASGRPDIVLMDFRLPGRSGIDACRDIVRQWPATRVIMLTSYADDTLVAEAIEAGASGYLLKRVAAAELLSAIEAVANGGASLDPSVARSVVDRLRHAEQSRVMAGFGDLTRRELRSWRSWPKAEPTRRSPRPCSSARRPSRITSPRSSRSSGCPTASRQRPMRSSTTSTAWSTAMGVTASHARSGHGLGPTRPATETAPVPIRAGGGHGPASRARESGAMA